MKKILKYIIPLIATVSVIAACSSEDMDDFQFNIAFGTLDGTADNPLIKLDDYTKLDIVDVGAPTTWEEVADKYAQKDNTPRVYINYTTLDTDDSTVPVSHKVRLNRFYALLVKNMETLSTMSAEQRSALGTDPIGVRSANIGGGYLNLSFDVYYNPESSAYYHVVELVYDDENYSDGDIHLVLYHKGDPTAGYKEGALSTNWASFAIPEAIASVDNSTKLIKLHWRWYDDAGNIVDREEMNVFSPYGNITQRQEVGDQPRTICLK